MQRNWVRFSQNSEKWNNIEDYQHDLLIPNFKFLKEGRNQARKTDFSKIIEDISKYYINDIWGDQNSPEKVLVVTIISDFWNDKNVVIENISYHLKKIKNRERVRMNLLVLPKNENITTENSISSEKMLEEFSRYFSPQYLKVTKLEQMYASYDANENNPMNADIFWKFKHFIPPNRLIEKHPIKFIYRGKRPNESEAVIKINRKDNNQKELAFELQCLQSQGGNENSHFVYAFPENVKAGEKTLDFGNLACTKLGKNESIEIKHKNSFYSDFPNIFLSVLLDNSNENFIFPVQTLKGLTCQSICIMRSSFWVFIFSALALFIPAVIYRRSARN